MPTTFRGKSTPKTYFSREGRRASSDPYPTLDKSALDFDELVTPKAKKAPPNIEYNKPTTYLLGEANCTNFESKKDYLKKCRDLRKIKVRGEIRYFTTHYGEGLVHEALKNNPNLKEIVFSRDFVRCELSTKFMSSLPNFSDRIQILDFRYVSIEEESVEYITQLKNLKTLYIGSKVRMNVDHLKVLAENCQFLERLDLGGHPTPCNKYICGIFPYCHKKAHTKSNQSRMELNNQALGLIADGGLPKIKMLSMALTILEPNAIMQIFNNCYYIEAFELTVKEENFNEHWELFLETIEMERRFKMTIEMPPRNVYRNYRSLVYKKNRSNVSVLADTFGDVDYPLEIPSDDDDVIIVNVLNGITFNN